MGHWLWVHHARHTIITSKSNSHIAIAYINNIDVTKLITIPIPMTRTRTRTRTRTTRSMTRKIGGPTREDWEGASGYRYEAKQKQWRRTVSVFHFPYFILHSVSPPVQSPRTTTMTAFLQKTIDDDSQWNCNMRPRVSSIPLPSHSLLTLIAYLYLFNQSKHSLSIVLV